MEDIKYEVTFSEENYDLRPNQVVISPISSGWNDFGFKVKCKFELLVPDTKLSFSGDMFIGFLPPENALVTDLEAFKKKNYSLAQLLPLLNKQQLNREPSIRFFTMLPNMGGYRNIVEQLGVEETANFLNSVNDLVYNKDINEKWFSEAIKSEVFTLGFMRNSEPFFAFSNADSVLGGVEEEVFKGISQQLNLKYTLDGFDNSHDIKLLYSSESLIPKRINILIGKNGLGKSQALKSFCRAALQTKDELISLKDKAQVGGRPMINRLLAIATPGETQNTFPAERRKTQKLFYRRLSLTRNSRTKVTRSIGELLVQLARSEEMIGEESRWDLFYKSLAEVLAVDELSIPLNDNTSVPLKYIKHFSGEQHTLELWAKIDKNSDPRFKLGNTLYPLSSGQLTFFKFALLCCLYIENGSFVLMDEPETHMHPNMISDFVDLLDFLLEKTGSQALIATHSAYFVREISREQVHVFTNQGKEVSIVNPRLRTFGADVDSISQFVFDEDVDNKLVDKIYNKIKTLTFEEVEEQLESELSMSAMMNLKSRMTD